MLQLLGIVSFIEIIRTRIWFWFYSFVLCVFNQFINGKLALAHRWEESPIFKRLSLLHLAAEYIHFISNSVWNRNLHDQQPIIHQRNFTKLFMGKDYWDRLDRYRCRDVDVIKGLDSVEEGYRVRRVLIAGTKFWKEKQGEFFWGVSWEYIRYFSVFEASYELLEVLWHFKNA